MSSAVSTCNWKGLMATLNSRQIPRDNTLAATAYGRELVELLPWDVCTEAYQYVDKQHKFFINMFVLEFADSSAYFLYLCLQERPDLEIIVGNRVLSLS